MNAPDRPDLRFLRRRQRQPGSGSGATAAGPAAANAVTGHSAPGRSTPDRPAAGTGAGPGLSLDDLRPTPPADPPAATRQAESTAARTGRHPARPGDDLDLGARPTPTRPAASGPDARPTGSSGLELSHPNRPPLHSPDLSLDRLAAPGSTEPVAGTERPGAPDLSLGPAGATAPAGPGPDLSLGPAHPAAPSRPASPGLDLGRAAASSPPTAPPMSPGLGWIRRRPAQRSAPDLRRTGNDAVDFSAVPVVGGVGPQRRDDFVPPLRGRTVLTSERPKVLIGGEQAANGSLQFTLTWSPLGHPGAVRPSTDLHLGCLWEMNDRSAGLIQLLDGGPDSARCDGNTVMRLGGRSEIEGQTLVASLRHLRLLKRMVLFAYAAGGTPDWGSLSVHLSATLKGGVSVEIAPSPGPPWATLLVAASVHRVGGTLVLRREDQYLSGQQRSAGWAYGFDSLSWLGDRTLAQTRLR